jgi:hypothetical protein
MLGTYKNLFFCTKGVSPKRRLTEQMKFLEISINNKKPKNILNLIDQIIQIIHKIVKFFQFSQMIGCRGEGIGCRG